MKPFASYPNYFENEKGFAVDSFVGMDEDESGNLYFATPVGLTIKYVGGDMVTLGTGEGLKSNSVKNVIVMGSHIIVSYTKGISISKDGGITFSHYTDADGLNNSTIGSIRKRNENTFYVLGFSGVEIVDLDGNVLDHWTTANGLLHNSSIDVIETGGHIFVATALGLNISNDGGSTFSSYTTAEGLISISIRDLAFDGDSVFIATNSGISITHDFGANFINKDDSDGILHNSLKQVIVLENGDIYLGGTWGISFSDDGGNTFSDSGILDSMTISQFFITSGQKTYINSSSGAFSYTVVDGLKRLKELKGVIEGSVGEIEQDGNGKIYYLLENGYLTSTDGGQTFDESEEMRFLGKGIRMIEVSDNGEDIYLAGSDGIFISNDGGVNFRQITTADGLDNNSVLKLDVDSSGNIYAITISPPSARRLNISFDGGNSWVVRSTADGIGHDYMEDVLVDDVTGNIYVASWGGVAVSTDGGANFTNASTANGLGHNQVYTLAIDSLGNIYAGTYNGLGISSNNGASYTNRTTAHGLGHNNVRLVKIDQNDRIHLQTPYASTYDYSDDYGTSFTSLVSGENFPEATFRDVDIINGEHVLVGRSGLYFSSDNFTTTRVTEYKTIPKFSTVNDISFAGGRMYVADMNGMWFSDDNGKTFTVKTNMNSGIEPGNVMAISHLDENRFAVGTSTGVAFSFDKGSTYFNSTLPFTFYMKLDFDSSENLYAAYFFNGLTIVPFGSFGSGVTRTTADGLGSNNVEDIFVDENDDVYVGTSAGLSISTNGGLSFINKTTADGLPSDAIAVVKGSTSHLFVGTGVGLAISTDGGSSFVVKTVADGLVSDNITCILVDDSTIYVGTDKGVSVSYDNGNSFELYADNSLGISLGGVTALAKSPEGKIFIGAESAIYTKRSN